MNKAETGIEMFDLSDHLPIVMEIDFDFSKKYSLGTQIEAVYSNQDDHQEKRFHPAPANINQPAMKDSPPIGATMPKAPTPVKAMA